MQRLNAKDIPFSGKIFSDIICTTEENFKGEQERLNLDVYLPPENILKNENPFILVIHGGGFLKGDKSVTSNFCKLLANKGFVIATIDYRLGWPMDKGEDPCASADSVAAIKAFYRAQQDAQTALRFMMANANKYAIDTGWVFVAGSSAGGISTLGMIYYTQEISDKMYPFASASLGNLNEAGENLKSVYHIKAISSMWGALNTPLIIKENNAIPTIFFHGEKDKVVPFDIDNFHSCINYPVDYGTKPLYQRMVALNVPAEAYIDPEGGHGVYSDKFRADKIAEFFKGVMTKDYQTGYYVFEEEE